tara:strand:+ start:21222 stop:21323 length:102 start_codon:yes stop_codon:yes gene_type:complete
LNQSFVKRRGTLQQLTNSPENRLADYSDTGRNR